MDDIPYETKEWTDGELDTTKEEDQEWLAIKEECLFFNEALFARKYNEIASKEVDKASEVRADAEGSEVSLMMYIIYAFGTNTCA